MVNYACAFSQSESGKYFEWIINNINIHSRKYLIQHSESCTRESHQFKGVFTWENSHRCEFHTVAVSYRGDFLISYRVYMMTGSFHISLFEDTLHLVKIHVWFKIANITHAPPIPVYQQTDFTPKRVDVLRLHDTVARFGTRVKFSPRYKNRGELTPGWLALAWHFVVVSCKQI